MNHRKINIAMCREMSNVILQFMGPIRIRKWCTRSCHANCLQGSIPTMLPTYVVVEFDNYIGSPWDQYKPKHIPIPPVNQSNKKQIPLKMAWPLPIHKSQGLKLTRSIIDIGTMDFLYLL